MRIKINNGSAARRAPKSAPAGRRQPPPPPNRLLEALSLPETRLDTAWGSEPTFTRGPKGWYRVGCFA